jgi:26S proteasome regulatory subunit N9
MALIESVFRRPANDRTMSFQTIGEETRLPVDEVEHLVMKALRWVARARRRVCADAGTV